VFVPERGEHSSELEMMWVFQSLKAQAPKANKFSQAAGCVSRRSPAIAAALSAGGISRRLLVQATCGALSAGARPTLRIALINSDGRPHSELTKIAVTLTAIATIAQTGWRCPVAATVCRCR
jgi:hypothetical protein